MKLGILVLNFGEPAEATPGQVIPFLERIFLANAGLEDPSDPDAGRRRSRELAERRAPGLIEEYREIGSSPMNAQALAQAEALEAELLRRGHAPVVLHAFQFTDPLVAEGVARAREAGVTTLVGLPVYPLCGPSTTVAALNDVQKALDALGWAVDFRGISGWHRHPLYLDLRADAIRDAAARDGVSLAEAGSRLVFSAHGTPKKYLGEGSRYVEYVEEFCRETASRLGIEGYDLGYQNHTNRKIEWTQPDITEVVRSVRATRIVVDPISFMHEQSETLAELDIELREEAEKAGLAFHRVPVPHDDARFAVVLADLVEAILSEDRAASGVSLRPCRCRATGDTFCLNAPSQKA
ncbi:MAG: ferrochelatase [Gemmatimonadota bacterium]